MTRQIHPTRGPRRSRSASLRFLSIAAIIGLAGCSLLKIAYNNLDWVIPWYVGDYITLTDRQEVLLNELIDKELRWHRSSQLPLYARSLRQLSHDVEAGFTDAKLTQYMAQFEEFRKALMQETATHLATLLETASDNQIEELFRNFAEHNRTFSETYIDRTPEELQSSRLERMEGIFADWLGPLTKTQRAAIGHWSQQRGSIAPEVSSYRNHWQVRLRTVLGYRSDAERFREDMQLLFLKPHLYSPDTYLAKRERNVELGKELFLAIMNAATPAQRKRLRKNLDGYARDFEQLSMQS